MSSDEKCLYEMTLDDRFVIVARPWLGDLELATNGVISRDRPLDRTVLILMSGKYMRTDGNQQVRIVGNVLDF